MTNSPALEQGTIPTSGAGDSVRLNLGGRDSKIKGFKTVDLENGSDYRLDVSDLYEFKEGSVDEIYASHVLEHFPHTKTVAVLKEWRRVLKSGAKAHIAVPDFDAAVRLYLRAGFNELLNHLLWGDQGYDLAYHYTGFTFPTLSLVLIKSGFRDVKRLTAMPYGAADCSTLRDTYYGEPLSLNVEATA